MRLRLKESMRFLLMSLPYPEGTGTNRRFPSLIQGTPYMSQRFKTGEVCQVKGIYTFGL